MLALNNITLYITFLAVLLVPFSTAAAASQVGVVVRHSDGSVVERCISFDSASIKGLTLLQDAKLNPVLDNGFLVELDGEKGQSGWSNQSGTNFWYSWYSEGGAWQDVHSGVSTFILKDGQIYGWQDDISSLKIPEVTFSQVCPPEQKTPESIPVQQTSLIPVSQGGMGALPSQIIQSPVANSNPSPSTTDTPVRINDNATSQNHKSWPWVLAGLFIAALLLGAVIGRRRM
jgi:hypothetical protein